MFDRPPSEGEILKKIEHADTGYIGLVGIEGVIDDPSSPDYGKVVAHHHFNTITKVARQVMARALAGDPSGAITTVAWGTGTNAATRDDTALQTEVITSAVISPVTYPDTDSVLFSSTLPRNVGTGYTYSEVGLKSAGGLLFARFKFPGVYKFEQLRLSVNWQIIFS